MHIVPNFLFLVLASLSWSRYSFSISCYLGDLLILQPQKPQLSYHHSCPKPPKTTLFPPLFASPCSVNGSWTSSRSDLVQTRESPLILPVPSVANYVTRSIDSIPQDVSSTDSYCYDLGQAFLIYCLNYCQSHLYGSFLPISLRQAVLLWPLLWTGCCLAQTHSLTLLYLRREVQAPQPAIWGSLHFLLS